MTDADPRANGYPPRAEFAPQAPVPVPVNSSPDDASPRVPVHSPEIDEAAETGEPGYGSLAQPGSGGATAWPAWPGVARPAGWFLSVPREAAPLGPADREPARPDNRPSGSGAAWPPGNPAALLAWLPQAPSPREAAPLGPADREPARPDDRLPGSGAASPPGNPAALLAWLPQAPSQEEEEPPWPDE